MFYYPVRRKIETKNFSFRRLVERGRIFILVYQNIS